MMIVLFCRVFGTMFAEIPFVATRDGYRREGNLKRLMQVACSLQACGQVSGNVHVISHYHCRQRLATAGMAVDDLRLHQHRRWKSVCAALE
jgi:hypothetical protein